MKRRTYSARPRATGDTRFRWDENSFNVLTLRPAEQHIDYKGYDNRGGTCYAWSTKRTDDTWLILDSRGTVVAVLAESSGERPWVVCNVRDHAVVSDGTWRGFRTRYRLSNMLKADGATWVEALLVAFSLHPPTDTDKVGP